MRSKIGLVLVAAAFVATVLLAPGGDGTSATAWSLLPPLLAISLALQNRESI